MKKFVGIALVVLMCIGLLSSCRAKDKCPGVGEVQTTQTTYWA